MEYISQIDYQLKLNLHSKIMLALRYGIATEAESISGFFQGYERPNKTKQSLSDDRENSSSRVLCKFNIEGQQVLALMQETHLITVYPKLRSLSTPDALGVAHGFDFALALEPDLFTMSEIVSWRDEYLESNGKITKDDLRRKLKRMSKRADKRSPLEMLGLPENFLEEVKELRSVYEDIWEIYHWVPILGSLTKEDLKENDQERFLEARKLANAPQTHKYEETPHFLNVELPEIIRELNEQKQEDYDNRFDQLLEDEKFAQRVAERPKNAKIEPLVGTPSNGKLVGENKGNPIYSHENYTVMEIVLNEREDGWHEIHYESTQKRFITTTKQKWIIDSYSVGQKGIWTISYGELSYLATSLEPKGMDVGFYQSPEWLKLRYEKIKNSSGKCNACGSGERLEVDHIKPRSRYPALQYEFTNLQVLCHKCNRGKGNTDTTDFRK